MPVTGVGASRAAPLELDLEPGDMLAADGIIDRVIVLDTGADALLGIDKGGEGRGEAMTVVQLGQLDFGYPIVSQRERRAVAETIMERVRETVVVEGDLVAVFEEGIDGASDHLTLQHHRARAEIRTSVTMVVTVPDLAETRSVDRAIAAEAILADPE